jgi:hypothetical protein
MSRTLDEEKAFATLLDKSGSDPSDPDFKSVAAAFRDAIHDCEFTWLDGELVIRTGVRRPGSGVKKTSPAIEERPCSGCGANLQEGQTHTSDGSRRGT